MSKRTQKSEDDVHELVEIDVDRIDGVGRAASGLPFLILKSVAPETKFGRNAGRRLSPAARAAFEANSEAVRQGRKPKQKGKVDKKRRRIAQPAMAAKAASGYGGPAVGVGEADSILRYVTGESGATCGAMTADGSPCRRPSVGGQRCHLHS